MPATAGIVGPFSAARNFPMKPFEFLLARTRATDCFFGAWAKGGPQVARERLRVAIRTKVFMFTFRPSRPIKSIV